MDIFEGKKKSDRVYKGAYSYFKNQNIYSEETFEVFKDRKELKLNFCSQILCRVSTGELLKFSVDYTVNKEFLPQKVIIYRNLGKDDVVETFLYDKKKGVINYEFKNKGEITEAEIVTTPKFHIASPTTVNSALFIKSKKENTGGKNYYNIITSFNQWKYEEKPITKYIAMQRLSTTTETYKIDGTAVQALQYKITEEEPDKDDNLDNLKPTAIKIWLSQHNGIPYSVESEDGTKIQIKFLNDLDRE